MSKETGGPAFPCEEAAADKINHVPKYVRQAVKMLTKALREHEKKAGIVDTKPERPSPQTDRPMGELRDESGRLPHKIT